MLIGKIKTEIFSEVTLKLVAWSVNGMIISCFK